MRISAIWALSAFSNSRIAAGEAGAGGRWRGAGVDAAIGGEAGRSAVDSAGFGSTGCMDGFAPPGRDGKSGLGRSSIYVDDRSGAIVDRDIAGHGSIGDIYLQAQYQLHTGRILGLPGRILVCVSGILVAMLSVTGVYIWLRKRRARA